jgi:hypothetical protein
MLDLMVSRIRCWKRNRLAGGEDFVASRKGTYYMQSGRNLVGVAGLPGEVRHFLNRKPPNCADLAHAGRLLI